MNSAGAFRTLYECAKDHIDADQLKDIGESLIQEAEDLAFRSAEITEGIACLVASDSRSQMHSGSLQDSDGVFNLLCMLSKQFLTIGTLLDVGEKATWQAARMREKS